MFRHEYQRPTLRDRLRSSVHRAAGPAIRWTWDQCRAMGGIGPDSAAGRRFGSMGEGSIVCFPNDTLMNPGSIHLGSSTMIAAHVALAAGWGPNHPGLGPRIVVIGDRCLIGRGSSVIGHQLIEIGDDVWTGHHVHITDMNHGYEDVDQPISVQAQGPRPIHIGSGSWIGHGCVILPGVTIGRHVVVGAGSCGHHRPSRLQRCGRIACPGRPSLRPRRRLALRRARHRHGVGRGTRLMRGAGPLSRSRPKQRPSQRAPMRAVIIGAGPAGLCAAIQLREAGVTDIVILERSTSVGGTWRANTYPGASCDVPSRPLLVLIRPET